VELKPRFYGKLAYFFESSNRTNVELKQQCREVEKFAAIASNRTNVELKQLSFLNIPNNINSSNRTNVELKPVYHVESNDLLYLPIEPMWN